MNLFYYLGKPSPNNSSGPWLTTGTVVKVSVILLTSSLFLFGLAAVLSPVGPIMTELLDEEPNDMSHMHAPHTEHSQHTRHSHHRHHRRGLDLDVELLPEPGSDLEPEQDSDLNQWKGRGCLLPQGTIETGVLDDTIPLK